MGADWKERISINPNVCFGKPCVKGTRLWVSMILDLLADGMATEEILKEYPALKRGGHSGMYRLRSGDVAGALRSHCHGRLTMARFKLDENFGASIQQLFSGHDCHTVREEGLGGATDTEVFGAAARESRILVTLDLDFANVLAFPPKDSTASLSSDRQRVAPPFNYCNR